MRKFTVVFVLAGIVACTTGYSADQREIIAVIGTGDMGNSLRPKLAKIDYRVIYGSRDPARESTQALVGRTGSGTTAKTQKEAAQAADIVLLAVPWP